MEYYQKEKVDVLTLPSEYLLDNLRGLAASVLKLLDNKVFISDMNFDNAIINENEIRVMGRTASGVKGINLGDASCVSMENVEDSDNILIVTENGYGKKTLISEYRVTKRGSKGVKALNITEKNGNIASIKKVIDDNDLMIITNQGIIIRLPLDQVSQLGRVTQGTRLINLKENQKVSSVSLILKEKNDVDSTQAEETTNEIKEQQ